MYYLKASTFPKSGGSRELSFPQIQQSFSAQFPIFSILIRRILIIDNHYYSSYKIPHLIITIIVI